MEKQTSLNFWKEEEEDSKDNVSMTKDDDDDDVNALVEKTGSMDGEPE